jgi:16S rRNA (guanine966-N2)-methyltransferase
MHGTLAGARFLDLYAGSGAVGLEAMSRGAASAVLVESDRSVLRVLRANLAELGLDGAVVVASTVDKFVAEQADGPYNIVFVDPPYSVGSDRLGAVLGDLRRHGWLADQAIVVVERASRDSDFTWPDGYVAQRSRRYGEGSLWYGRAAMETAGSTGADG